MPESRKVLVVEDNDFVRMQIVSHLKGAGYETHEAADGDQALSCIESDSAIGIAVVDVRMDPMGGFEFIKILRDNESRLPVILVTADDTADLLEQAGKYGVAAVLMKPVQKERLLHTVERSLAASRKSGRIH
ncbi:MAG: response regulator [Alphaproteobacteria bacterium]|nr:response regulator [Alphaproteobacteria bacterium]